MKKTNLIFISFSIGFISFGSSFGAASVFSKEAVSQHSKRSDCWIIVEDGVYDITRAVQDHDRYKYQLDQWCGKDATQAWKTKDSKNKAHSRKAQIQLDGLRIGKFEKSAGSH